MLVFTGTLKDIKRIEPVKIGDKYYICVTDYMGVQYLDYDSNSYPERVAYECETLDQAQDYCRMILEGMDAYEFSQRDKQ